MSLPATQRVVYLLGPETVELREDPVPAPESGELIVRIEAATTCGTDVKVFRRGGHPRMLRVPTPFGHEFAGTIVACGSGVDGWSESDRVVVANSACCGVCRYCERGQENLCPDLQYLNGAFAEYVRVPKRFVARSVHRLPDALPMAWGALAEPLACVLHGVDVSALADSEEALVFGGGPIGLLFVAVLAARRHRVVLADPNPSRLEAGRQLGAAATVCIERGGGQSEAVRAHATDPDGFDACIDATGIPAVWDDALASVRPGGSVNWFGGCAPGTVVPVDTHRVHYSQITIKAAYHHRPATFAAALDVLGSRQFDPGVLLSADRPLTELEEALRSMMRKEALKVVIRPQENLSGNIE